MKLNLLIDTNEPLTRGPGRRAKNLITGLTRNGIDFEICSKDYEWAVGLQNSKVFNCWQDLPTYVPIGPNVMHNAGDHKDIACKFSNYIVQSLWVKDYWLWQYPSPTDQFTFHIYPASVDIKDGFEEIAMTRKPSVNCLFYTKYQSGQNRLIAESIYKGKNHSVIPIIYGEYTQEQLKEACAKAEYCIFNSCCEKSSNALIEIMACGVPVYVIDSKRWIGDDKFDRCTTAPDFSPACGMLGDFFGTDFNDFYDNVKEGKYDPFSFVKNGYTVEIISNLLVEIVKKCHE
jgi:hypothetical protein